MTALIFQLIWDEVGESDEERDKMLLQLEQECLDVYKRKVEQASKTRALLLQSLADSKAELARLLSALGEKSFVGIVSFIVLHRFQLTRDYLKLESPPFYCLHHVCRGLFEDQFSFVS